MDEDQIYNLDREMNILRTLTERTPRGEGSLARGLMAENEGQNRNDAVVGSSRTFSVSRDISIEQDNRDKAGFTPPVGFQGRPEDPRMSNQKFVSVEDLSLDPEDPPQRRYAASEFLDRTGGHQNQYFPRGESRSDGRRAFLENQRKVLQLKVSGLGSGDLHFPSRSGVFAGVGDLSEAGKRDPERDC
jgi:hypothetical protein